MAAFNRRVLISSPLQPVSAYLQHLTVPLIGSWMSPSISTTILAKPQGFQTENGELPQFGLKTPKAVLVQLQQIFCLRVRQQGSHAAHTYGLCHCCPARPLRPCTEFWGAGHAVLGCKTISAFLPGETQQARNPQGGWFFTCECPLAKAPARILATVWGLQRDCIASLKELFFL